MQSLPFLACCVLACFAAGSHAVLTAHTSSLLRMHGSCMYRSGELQSATPLQASMPLKTFKGHKAPVRGIVVLPDAGHVASASSDGRLLLWEYSQATVLRKFQHAEEFTCLACR